MILWGIAYYNFFCKIISLNFLKNLRINKRWEELDIENAAISKAKNGEEKYVPLVLANGDTTKQLLARCRYTLVKKKKLDREPIAKGRFTLQKIPRNRAGLT